MTKKIGVQLYSVRDNLASDFEKTVKEISAMGFAGVEPAGVPSGTSFADAGKLFKSLGLTVCSAHTGLPIGKDSNRIIEEMQALDSTLIISGRGPDDFKTIDKIKMVCDWFNEAAEVAARNGMRVGMHNHDWEYLPVEGELAYRHLIKYLDPRVFFEIDTYWVKTAGADPAAVVKELGERVLFLHIKDGPCKKGQPMVAAGSGSMDFPPIVEAASSAEWIIVELDACATDMMEAVRNSFNYLSNTKLGKGK